MEFRARHRPSTTDRPVSDPRPEPASAAKSCTPRCVPPVACLQYARETQRTALPHIRSISTEQQDGSVILDAATRRNLELDANLMGGSDNTLVSVMDRTATPMGSRLLRRWLHRPLRDIDCIRQRQQCIGSIDGRLPLRSTATPTEADRRYRADSGPGGAALGSAAGSGTAQTGAGLPAGAAAAQLAPLDSPLASKLATQISEFPTLQQLLESAIIDSPPVVIRDGGVIAEGYDRRAGRAALAERKRWRLSAGAGTAREGAHRHRHAEGRL